MEYTLSVGQLSINAKLQTHPVGWTSGFKLVALIKVTVTAPCPLNRSCVQLFYYIQTRIAVLFLVCVYVVGHEGRLEAQCTTSCNK